MSAGLLQPLFAACEQLNKKERYPLYSIQLDLGRDGGCVRMLLVRGGACVGVKERVEPTAEAFAAAASVLVKYEIERKG
jgi:hypothetical protein